jgi:hypothetical protein
MTQCKTEKEVSQLAFDLDFGKEVVGAFDGGSISTDGGLVLLRQIDNKLRLSEQINFCIADQRQQAAVKHKQEEIIRQRLYAIAAGYEDANDANFLRDDAMHRMSVKGSVREELASQPTISRLENSVVEKENEFLQELLPVLYIQQFKKPPHKVVLDVDTTCDEAHGYQQLTFFNGFYGTYCYVPMFIFDSNGFPLSALLRAGNAAPAEGALKMLKQVVEHLRQAWPDVAIDFRGDAAFCLPELYSYCEKNRIQYFIGLKPNHSVDCKTRDLVSQAKSMYESVYGQSKPLIHGKKDKRLALVAWRKKEERIRFSSKEEGRIQEHFEDEKRIRLVGDFPYEAREWRCERRVICRVDYTEEGPDVRYIITNNVYGRPKWIYEDKYCRRGQCENWIKEIKNYLKCDRTSCQEFAANQFRLLLHVFAYLLLREIRNKLPSKTANISVQTVMQRFIKIGVLVKETTRKIWLHYSSGYPAQLEFTCPD